MIEINILTGEVKKYQYFRIKIIPLIHLHTKHRKSSDEDRETDFTNESTVSVPRHLSVVRQEVKKTLIQNVDPDLKELEKSVAARLGSFHVFRKGREENVVCEG